MLFMVFYEDKPGMADKRSDLRPKHVEYMERFKDAIVAGGPTLLDDGKTMDGSLFIVDMPDKESVMELVKNEPYSYAGILQRVTIKKWHKVRLVEIDE